MGGRRACISRERGLCPPACRYQTVYITSPIDYRCKLGPIILSHSTRECSPRKSSKPSPWFAPIWRENCNLIADDDRSGSHNTSRIAHDATRTEGEELVRRWRLGGLLNFPAEELRKCAFVGKITSSVREFMARSATLCSSCCCRCTYKSRPD